MFVLILVACTDRPPTRGDSEVPGSPLTFRSFYEQLQDKVCPLAEDDCPEASAFLDCDARTDLPSCDAFNPAAAALCLEGESTCSDGFVQGSSACDEVCANLGFQQIGLSLITPNCEQMLSCDEAINHGAPSYTQVFPDGLEDVSYGTYGNCYRQDAAACDAACVSAVTGFRYDAQRLVDDGLLDAVPEACL